MTTTGQRFKEIRQALNMPQDKFGEKIGLSKSGVSAVENDKTFVSIEILRTLFIDYDVNLNYLIVGSGSIFNSKENCQKESFTFRVEEVLRKNGLLS